MQEPKDIFNNNEKSKIQPLVLDLSSYFQNTIKPEDYSMAYEFSKINPILEMVQREIILDENLLESKPEKKEMQFTPKNIEEKIQQSYGNSNVLKERGLEHTLSTQSPIIVVMNTPSYTNYGNQSNSNFNYISSPRNNYHRQFAWYDIAKPNILAPMYYRRH